MRSYPVDEVYEEMAFIAFHFHWPRKELMALEHAERRRWCEEISHINREFNDAPSNPFEIA